MRKGQERGVELPLWLYVRRFVDGILRDERADRRAHEQHRGTLPRTLARV
jgi:hypothetical protein